MLIAAVIVTYKRHKLLIKCLKAVVEQKKQVDNIYIIDNANELKVKSMVNSFASQVSTPIMYFPMQKNVGGAGGFSFGINKAYEAGMDWIWILDDDTYATPNTLSAIYNIISNNKFDNKIFASSVFWKNGYIHPMNYPTIKWKPYDLFHNMVDNRLIPIRHTSFVSLVISSECVKKYGLPYSDYFIWNDDAEYTARIMRQNNGCLVLDSKVYHLTKTFQDNVYEAIPKKFFFEIRNKIWMILFSNAWDVTEKVKLFARLLIHIYKFFTQNQANIFLKCLVLFKGLIMGIFTKPKK